MYLLYCYHQSWFGLVSHILTPELIQASTQLSEHDANILKYHQHHCYQIIATGLRLLGLHIPIVRSLEHDANTEPPLFT